MFLHLSEHIQVTPSLSNDPYWSSWNFMPVQKTERMNFDNTWIASRRSHTSPNISVKESESTVECTSPNLIQHNSIENIPITIVSISGIENIPTEVSISEIKNIPILIANANSTVETRTCSKSRTSTISSVYNSRIIANKINWQLQDTLRSNSDYL